MRSFVAPELVNFQTIPRPAVFLAGSIDMGAAEDWQRVVTEELADLPGSVLNPRRAAWDPSWPNDAQFKPFREQVTWELDGLDGADVVLVNFEADSKAPISLLELGLHARTKKVVVACPPAYWRHGNVQITCERHAIPLFSTLSEALKLVQDMVLAAARPSAA